jgi:hypothetical protein
MLGCDPVPSVPGDDGWRSDAPQLAQKFASGALGERQL